MTGGDEERTYFSEEMMIIMTIGKKSNDINRLENNNN